MADETGRSGWSGDERHNPWAPPRDGVSLDKGSMNQNEQDRQRRSVAEQPTITSASGAVPPPVPPAPVPPAPVPQAPAPQAPVPPPPGASPGVPPGGPGGAPGSGYGSSPYGHQAYQGYGNGGAAYGYPPPAPQPFGYGAGRLPGPAAFPGGFSVQAPPPNGRSVAAMVTGIIGLVAVSTCWGSFLGIFLSPVALGLGISARRAADRGEMGGRGQAVAGFVMGIIGTVLSVIFIAFLVVMLTFYNKDLDENGPGGGGDGSSLDARRGTAALVLHGSATADHGV